MKSYKCFVEGENFPNLIEGQRVLVGFYTTRYVQAESVTGAQEKAIAMLKAAEQLQVPEGIEPCDESRLTVEKTEEIPAGEMPEDQPGFCFFPMEE